MNNGGMSIDTFWALTLWRKYYPVLVAKVKYLACR